MIDKIAGSLAAAVADVPDGATIMIGGFGGAMDLAIGAKQVFVIMDHQTKKGGSKIVRPQTGPDGKMSGSFLA